MIIRWLPQLPDKPVHMAMLSTRKNSSFLVSFWRIKKLEPEVFPSTNRNRTLPPWGMPPVTALDHACTAPGCHTASLSGQNRVLLRDPLGVNSKTAPNQCQHLHAKWHLTYTHPSYLTSSLDYLQYPLQYKWSINSCYIMLFKKSTRKSVYVPYVTNSVFWIFFKIIFF